MKGDYKQNYFDFNGVRYGVGTIVKINPKKYINKRDLERCDGIAEFIEGWGSGYLKFKGVTQDTSKPCWIGIYPDTHDRIETIIKPVYYEYKPVWQNAIENYKNTHPLRRADIAPGTILYVAAMLVGTIFNARIGIWAIATFLYIKYLINMYKD